MGQLSQQNRDTRPMTVIGQRVTIGKKQYASGNKKIKHPERKTSS